MALFLGIDLGTSYFKVGLFDAAGKLKGLGRVALEVTSPAPGQFELAVDKFWELLRRALHDALVQAHAEPGEIAGLSYASQANTCVMLDQDDRPLTPFILWTDNRGEPVDARALEFAASDTFRRTVGFEGISGNWAVAKWNWFTRNKTAAAPAARRLMTIADYLTFSLTGNRVGDASTAAFLGLYDLHASKWWAPALATFGLQESQLSMPLLPGTIAGRTTPSAQVRLGLPAGIPFAVGGLDHHVAALGAGLGRFADVSISTGTVLATLALVPSPDPRPHCYHGPHFERGYFYRLAFDANGAGRLETYQREKAPELSLDTLLGQAAASSGVHGREVRLILDEIAATHAQLLDQVGRSAAMSRVVASGGGARSPLWLQIKADRMKVEIVTTTCSERGCLGAAMLAGVAAGKLGNLAEAADAMVHVGPIYAPRA